MVRHNSLKNVLIAYFPFQDGHSQEEIAAYRATFTKFDVDGGGAIDAAELGKLIRVLGWAWLQCIVFHLVPFRLNPTDDEVETIKREIDEDQSGEIDFQEFLEIMNCRTLRLH